MSVYTNIIFKYILLYQRTICLLNSFFKMVYSLFEMPVSEDLLIKLIMFYICDAIQQKHFSVYKCLKVNIHLSHRLHGECGLWYVLGWAGKLKKLSYIIISLQNLTLLCNCVSVESLHRLLL